MNQPTNTTYTPDKQQEYLNLAEDLGIDLKVDPRRDATRYSAFLSIFDVMVDMLYALDGFGEHPADLAAIEEVTSIPNTQDLLSLMVEDGLLSLNEGGRYELTEQARFLSDLHNKNG